MNVVMRILRLAHGKPTPFDGQYLKECDLSRDGVDSRGDVMSAHLVTTPNKAEAFKFESVEEATTLWKTVDPRQPWRPDGKPNRPLTAFTVTIESA